MIVVTYDSLRQGGSPPYQSVNREDVEVYKREVQRTLKHGGAKAEIVEQRKPLSRVLSPANPTSTESSTQWCFAQRGPTFWRGANILTCNKMSEGIEKKDNAKRWYTTKESKHETQAVQGPTQH